MRTALLFFPTKESSWSLLDAHLTSPRPKGVMGSAVVCLLSWDKTGTAPFTTLADVPHSAGISLFVCQIITVVVRDIDLFF